MTNLIAKRTGAQDRIIPGNFREKFRRMGFRVGTAPEGLPIVSEPTILAELKTEKPPEKIKAEPRDAESEGVRCPTCSRVCKTARGLKQHIKAAHDA